MRVRVLLRISSKALRFWVPSLFFISTALLRLSPESRLVPPSCIADDEASCSHDMMRLVRRRRRGKRGGSYRTHPSIGCMRHIRRARSLSHHDRCCDSSGLACPSSHVPTYVHSDTLSVSPVIANYHLEARTVYRSAVASHATQNQGLEGVDDSHRRRGRSTLSAGARHCSPPLAASESQSKP